MNKIYLYFKRCQTNTIISEHSKNCCTKLRNTGLTESKQIEVCKHQQIYNSFIKNASDFSFSFLNSFVYCKM